MSEENKKEEPADYSFLDNMFLNESHGRFGTFTEQEDKEDDEKKKGDDEKDDDEEKIEEGSAEDAKGTLDAIVGSLEKNDSRDKKQDEMLKMGKGMQDHYKKEGSFSPDQANWIFKMSKMFK